MTATTITTDASVTRPGPLGRPGSSEARSPRASHHSLARRIIRSIPLFPALGLLAVFMLGPVLWSLYGSLTNAALTGPNAANPQFVGLQNHVQLLTSDELPNAILLTVIFVCASAIVGQNGIGLACAMLLRHCNRIVGSIFGFVFIVAWVLPEIVAAFASYAFFHQKGTLNSILGVFGIIGPNWLYLYPMLAVILANIWRGTTFSMMVYSAALAEVPTDLLEAATMDGAGAFKRFRYVTLPCIRRSLAANLMLTTLLTLSVFTVIYVMTAGGPGEASTTLPILAFQEAFRFSKVGYGTAIAVFMMIIGAIFSFIYIKVLKPEVD